jgi:cysteine-S-conjugate beta-lyase
MTPSYAYFKYAAEHNNLEMVSSFLKEEKGLYTMDFNDIEEKAKDDKMTVCIFCNPHNPTGRVWTAEELKRFGDICLENNMWVISDEIHCDLLRSNQTHTPLAKLFPDSDRIITCMAPSKTFNLAGLKFSYIIIPNEKLRNIWKSRHYGMENPLSIEASRAAYESGHDWLIQLKEYLDNNFNYTKEYLSKNLPKADFRIAEATYLAWVKIEDYLLKEENYPLFFANNAGVLLEGGNMFLSNSDGYIRLNLACPLSVLKEGLKRICDALKSINMMDKSIDSL